MQADMSDPVLSFPAVAMGKAAGTLEVELWATDMGCSDTRKETLLQDIIFSSLSHQDLSSFAMPFLDGDVENADKNASRKVGYFQTFTFIVVAESIGDNHNSLDLEKSQAFNLSCHLPIESNTLRQTL